MPFHALSHCGPPRAFHPDILLALRRRRLSVPRGDAEAGKFCPLVWAHVTCWSADGAGCLSLSQSGLAPHCTELFDLAWLLPGKQKSFLFSLGVPRRRVLVAMPPARSDFSVSSHPGLAFGTWSAKDKVGARRLTASGFFGVHCAKPSEGTEAPSEPSSICGENGRQIGFLEAVGRAPTPPSVVQKFHHCTVSAPKSSISP